MKVLALAVIGGAAFLLLNQKKTQVATAAGGLTPAQIASLRAGTCTGAQMGKLLGGLLSGLTGNKQPQSSGKGGGGGGIGSGGGGSSANPSSKTPGSCQTACGATVITPGSADPLGLNCAEGKAAACNVPPPSVCIPQATQQQQCAILGPILCAPPPNVQPACSAPPSVPCFTGGGGCVFCYSGSGGCSGGGWFSY